MALATAATPIYHGKWYQHLYAQVLTAIVLGVLLGHFYPSLGEAMKPLGDAFIKMIKMVIAPIIFFTVVHGIASMKDMKKVGRVGLKALIYFELVTTAALIIGLIVINLWKPGVGHERRPERHRHQGHRELHGQSEGAEHRPFPHGHHPLDRGRRLRDGRDPAGPVFRDPVRLRAAGAGRARRDRAAPHRRRQPRLLSHRRLHHEARADRRLRRDGVHDRQVRRRHAAVARQLHARLLH